MARMEVPSSKGVPSPTTRACAMASRRSHTPRRDQRVKVCAAIDHRPNSSGRARHFAALVPPECGRNRHHRLLGGTVACSRHDSGGSSTTHCSFVTTNVAAPRRLNSSNAVAFKR
jgi:hypothetical protein